MGGWELNEKEKMAEEKRGGLIVTKQCVSPGGVPKKGETRGEGI